jgi:hypothetical protein
MAKSLIVLMTVLFENVQWTKLIRSSINDVATIIKVDSYDNIFIAGLTQENLDGQSN